MNRQQLHAIVTIWIIIHLQWSSAIASVESPLKTIAICGSKFFETDTDRNVDRSDYPETLRSAGINARLYALENGTVPMRAVHCSLEIQTCGVCQLSVDYLPPIEQFDNREKFLIEQMAHRNCQFEPDERKPCFDVQFIEDRFDATPSNRVYRSISIWTNPSRRQFNSTAYRLKILLTMWHVDANEELMRYVHRFFPMNISVFGKKQLVIHIYVFPDNTEIIYGVPNESIQYANQSSIGFIQSPRYPAAYPSAVHKNYTLVNQQHGGLIRLIFDDFQLHPLSQLRIIDSDGSELMLTMAARKLSTSSLSSPSPIRPSAIQSIGDKLTILFSGGDYTHAIGFRAKYEFVADNFWPERPDTRSCDDVLESYGGIITIASRNLPINSFVDCIWIIGRYSFPTQTFDRLYLKVEEFSIQSNGAGIRLEIRHGRTSVSDRLLLIFGAQTVEQLLSKQPQDGFVSELNDDNWLHSGFYVRLRGFIGTLGAIELTYAQFYRWSTAMCPGGVDEFHCDNSRCIKQDLTCDGRDHCGDYSDEGNQQCPDRIVQTGGSFNGEHPPSLFNMLALIIGVIVLVLFMLITTLIFARIYRQRLIRRFRREVADLANRQNSIYRQESCITQPDTAPSIQRVGDRRFYVLPENEISIFEAPPTYDDALKHPSVPTSGRVQPHTVIEQSPASVGDLPPAFENLSFTPNSEQHAGPSPLNQPIVDNIDDRVNYRHSTLTVGSSSGGSSSISTDGDISSGQSSPTVHSHDEIMRRRERIDETNDTVDDDDDGGFRDNRPKTAVAAAESAIGHNIQSSCSTTSHQESWV